MTEDTKPVSTTKLVVIDTKTRVAKSFEGTFACGEGHLPDPNDEGEEGNFTAKELIGQLNTFREAADGAQTRAKEKADNLAATSKHIGELSAEYEVWFDRFHPEAELDTFGL
jgi:hypothetical protein